MNNSREDLKDISNLHKRFKHTSFTDRIHKEKESYIDQIVTNNVKNSTTKFHKVKADLLLINKNEELFTNINKKNLTKRSSVNFDSLGKNFNNVREKKYLYTPNRDISDNFKQKYNSIIDNLTSADKKKENIENVNTINIPNNNISKFNFNTTTNTLSNSRENNKFYKANLQQKKNQIMKVLKTEKSPRKKLSTINTEGSILERIANSEEDNFTKTFVLKSSKHFDVKVKKKSFLVPKDQKLEELSTSNQLHKNAVVLMKRMLLDK